MPSFMINQLWFWWRHTPLLKLSFDEYIGYGVTTPHWYMLDIYYITNCHYADVIMTKMASHQPHGCLLNRLFRRRSNKTSKLRVNGLCVGNSPGPVNSPHKGQCFHFMTSSCQFILWTAGTSLLMCWGYCWLFLSHWFKSWSHNGRKDSSDNISNLNQNH